MELWRVNDYKLCNERIDPESACPGLTLCGNVGLHPEGGGRKPAVRGTAAGAGEQTPPWGLDGKEGDLGRKAGQHLHGHERGTDRAWGPARGHG